MGRMGRITGLLKPILRSVNLKKINFMMGRVGKIRKETKIQNGF